MLLVFEKFKQAHLGFRKSFTFCITIVTVCGYIYDMLQLSSASWRHSSDIALLSSCSMWYTYHLPISGAINSWSMPILSTGCGFIVKYYLFNAHSYNITFISTLGLGTYECDIGLEALNKMCFLILFFVWFFNSDFFYTKLDSPFLYMGCL